MNDPFPLKRGMALAQYICGELSPMCERLEIAGSIRRREAMVGDVDLVILTRQQADIIDRIRRRCQIVSGGTVGAQNTISVMNDGTQLDIFFARYPDGDLFMPIPGNFEVLFLTRTGSKEHNVALCQRALRMGLAYEPYRGVIRDGKVIAYASEAAIYRALDLPFLHPETDRKDGRLENR